MTKYKVPDGMLNAASTAIDYARKQGRGRSLSYDELPPGLALEITLEASIRWLDSQMNPVTSAAELNDWQDGYNAAIRFVRLIYSVPEPEVPEEIKDLLIPVSLNFSTTEGSNQRILEAFRRGQKSK